MRKAGENCRYSFKMKRQFFFLVFVFLSCFAFAQQKGIVYQGVPLNSTEGRALQFLDDSTVEMESFSPKTSTVTIRKYIFKLIDSTILIEDSNFKVNLFIKNKALIDTANQIIYVDQKDFQQHVFLVVIEGEKFYQKAELNAGLQSILGANTENDKLKRKLEQVQASLGSYEVKMYKGLKAFELYGYPYIFGVMEISRKP